MAGGAETSAVSGGALSSARPDLTMQGLADGAKLTDDMAAGFPKITTTAPPLAVMARFVLGAFDRAFVDGCVPSGPVA